MKRKLSLLTTRVLPCLLWSPPQWAYIPLATAESKNYIYWAWESLESPLRVPWDCKESPTSPFWRDQPWDFFGRNDAKAETPVLWPPHVKSWFIGKDWCWEGLGAGEEGDDRGWDGWMASLTRWTWIWVNSRSWWWTGRPGMLRFMWSQRVGHDWVTELNWCTELCSLTWRKFQTWYFRMLLR